MQFHENLPRLGFYSIQLKTSISIFSSFVDSIWRQNWEETNSKYAEELKARFDYRNPAGYWSWS
jgi:hypothetical protein